MSYLPSSRREFLKLVTTTAAVAPVPLIAAELESARSGAPQFAAGEDVGTGLFDGPASSLFVPVPITGNKKISQLDDSLVSKKMADACGDAPAGLSTAWGIPFDIREQAVFLKDKPVSLKIKQVKKKWFVFMHNTDTMPLPQNEHGFYRTPWKGGGYLNEHIADYVFVYEDGEEARVAIRQRHHIGMFQQNWGENCIQAVAAHKPMPELAHHEQNAGSWGNSQTRARAADRGRWINWLWAWQNPHPDKAIKAVRFEPLNKVAIVIAAITAGDVNSNPLRWQPRKKALFMLPRGVEFDTSLSEEGLLSQIRLDLGQVISAASRLIYPNEEWQKTYNNKRPDISADELVIEYAAHPEAQFHLLRDKKVALPAAEQTSDSQALRIIAPADQKVKIRVVEEGSNRPVAVKLHVHGEAGEYLVPVDRHRIPNNAWFEDYSVDFVHAGTHNCTYIPGETLMKLPRGDVFIEVSKGFEITPVRKKVTVTAETKEITITLRKVLQWREKGWVSADTHVHFLSPHSALLEGAAEGVNIVNLLASQWGELMTNVGDFDGKTTVGSRESGGDGEYLVRVGTENRQHVLGHISLLGYNGPIIAPMTTGGPDESALGDPVEILLTEWAQQCKKQDGVVVLPHFPNPRMENAAAIVSGGIDGVEMTSWGNLYKGIDPYSLTDWYRYLNCGYFVAAVGGTDKMSAGTAVGTIRTYTQIDTGQEFTYDSWKEAVRKGRTFVTYGPLLSFTVDGKQPGSRIGLSRSGGTVDIEWQVASVTVPMSRVELVVNGEVRESDAVASNSGQGRWSFQVGKSAWLALLIRGHYPDKPEIIAAHSSPVMVTVDGTQMFAAADAVTILEQIEGALAYIDTIGTRADDKTYKKMRMILQAAHRKVHNRMHQLGYYHEHTPLSDHPEHRSA